MNKQEALYLPVKKEGFIFSTDDSECKRYYRTLDGEEVSSSFKAKSKEELLDQLKPVVPKFVAEWYEIYKNDLDPAIYNIITRTYKKVNGENNDLLDTFETWFVYEDNSILTLVKMYLFGYEIEKEKLYTVEIPNPNLNAHVVLQKTEKGVVLVTVGNARWKGWESSKLTEAEIKQDFEWAFQFAKPVEETDE